MLMPMLILMLASMRMPMRMLRLVPLLMLKHNLRQKVATGSDGIEEIRSRELFERVSTQS